MIRQQQLARGSHAWVHFEAEIAGFCVWERTRHLTWCDSVREGTVATPDRSFCDHARKFVPIFSSLF